MWVVFLLFLLPLPLSVHAEDLGELSANLAGSFGLSRLSPGASLNFTYALGGRGEVIRRDMVVSLERSVRH